MHLINNSMKNIQKFFNLYVSNFKFLYFSRMFFWKYSIVNPLRDFRTKSVFYDTVVYYGMPRGRLRRRSKYD